MGGEGPRRRDAGSAAAGGPWALTAASTCDGLLLDRKPAWATEARRHRPLEVGSEGRRPPERSTARAPRFFLGQRMLLASV